MNAAQMLTLLEKNHYPFRNYLGGTCETLLFPGCSFPAQFPKTMATLSALCRTHGAGVAYNCCGKPVAELRRERDAARIARAITQRLERLAVREVVCLCPNCMEHLGRTLELPVVSVYALLSRWGYNCQNAPPPGTLFMPCPDRKQGETLAEISALLPLDHLRILNQSPCCGLRGDIAAHGPVAGDKLCTAVREQAAGETIYTYCASCSGQFQRHGCGRVRHLLCTLLGVEEAPDSAHALINRARTKFMK